jgi:hypothetical protein
MVYIGSGRGSKPWRLATQSQKIRRGHEGSSKIGEHITKIYRSNLVLFLT